MVFGSYDVAWWRENDTMSSHQCSPDEMDQVIKGSLAIEQYPINSNRDKAVVGNIVSKMQFIVLDI